jgi:hypothetical protein
VEVEDVDDWDRCLVFRDEGVPEAECKVEEFPRDRLFLVRRRAVAFSFLKPTGTGGV